MRLVLTEGSKTTNAVATRTSPGIVMETFAHIILSDRCCGSVGSSGGGEDDDQERLWGSGHASDIVLLVEALITSSFCRGGASQF